jgi:acyl-[acyl carrier protein]--UDP-N-acetylglucosamine O-acyltransferase
VDDYFTGFLHGEKKVGECWPMPSATMHHLLVPGNTKQQKKHTGENVKWVIGKDDGIR